MTLYSQLDILGRLINLKNAHQLLQLYLPIDLQEDPDNSLSLAEMVKYYLPLDTVFSDFVKNSGLNYGDKDNLDLLLEINRWVHSIKDKADAEYMAELKEAGKLNI